MNLFHEVIDKNVKVWRSKYDEKRSKYSMDLLLNSKYQKLEKEIDFHLENDLSMMAHLHLRIRNNTHNFERGLLEYLSLFSASES